MNIATTTPLLGPEFAKSIIDMALKVIDDTNKEVAQILWNHLLSFLSQNLMAVILSLLGLLLVSFLVALNGRWGMFGSVLYNYLYFGVLFIAGLIFGPYIFVNMYFDLFAVILYVTCFLMVGKVLKGLGLKR